MLRGLQSLLLYLLEPALVLQVEKVLSRSKTYWSYCGCVGIEKYYLTSNLGYSIIVENGKKNADVKSNL